MDEAAEKNLELMCLELEPLVWSRLFRGELEMKVLNLLRTMTQHRRKPACCALCFRIPSQYNQLRTTNSHKFPERVWKTALGQNHVYNPYSENKRMGTNKLTAEYYYLCQHRKRNPVFDCEKSVLSPLENSLSSFFSAYHGQKLSCSDHLLTYDNQFFGGLASVLYRTLLEHLLGNDQVSHDKYMDSVVVLLFELRKAVLAATSPSVVKVKIFVHFTHIPAFYNLPDNENTQDEWCRKMTLRTLSESQCIAQYTDQTYDYIHIASMSGMIVVGMTTATYQHLGNGLGINELCTEILPSTGQMLLQKNSERARSKTCTWLEDSLLTIDRKMAEQRRHMPNWSDNPEGARASPSTLNSRLIVLPREMEYLGEGELRGSRKFIIKEIGQIPEGVYKIYTFTGTNVPSRIRNLLLIEGKGNGGTNTQVISWYFYLDEDDNIKFVLSAECDAYTRNTDSAVNFAEQQARRNGSERTFLLRDLCLNILVNER